MYRYPLKFKAGTDPAREDLPVLDADKNEILFRIGIDETTNENTKPCVIFSDKIARQPLYLVLHQKQEEGEHFLIKTPGDALLGTVVAESEHVWKVMDPQGNLVACINEKSTWKNSCLYMLLTLPFDQSFSDEIFKIIAPHRYIVTINDKKVLELRQGASTFNDDYNLKKSGEFNEREEALLLVSLMMVLC